MDSHEHPETDCENRDFHGDGFILSHDAHMRKCMLEFKAATCKGQLAFYRGQCPGCCDI